MYAAAPASTAIPVIRAENLRLGYGDRIVLSDVRMRLDAGRVYGFEGPNGSGKSTLIRACLGLLRPLGGTLSVLGRSPGRRGFKAALQSIGYVPQQKSPGTLRITVREAVSMGRYSIAGLGRPLRPGDRRAVEEALEAAGIADLAESPVQELSGGQYQRTNIARALAMKPELYIFDEPSAFLDARGRDDVLALLERLAGQSEAGMVLVSHDPELLRLCSGVYAFGDGTVLPARPVPAERGDRDA